MPNKRLENGLKKALNDWQAWGLNEQPQLIRTFTEGKNHQTGLIAAGGNQYVLKIFNHSFDTAIDAQVLAAEHGIAPEIIHRGDNLALMEYLNVGPASLKETATTLRTLHQDISVKTDNKIHKSSLNLMQFYDEYLINAPPALRQQHTDLLPLLNEFINDPTPHCLCHNDLVSENCLSKNINKKNKALFIDWEYAAWHNPWFDLAAIVLYRGLNLDQAAEFLAHYNDWQDRVNERIFITSQIALLWGDLLWHVSQYGPDYQRNYSDRFEKLDNLSTKLDL